MNANGLFFLSGRPVPYIAPGEGSGHNWAFPLVERTRRGVQKVVAYWRGVEAESFVKAHEQRLKPGLALRLEFDGVRVFEGELEARITSCTLAPDRWPKTEIDPTAPPASHPDQPATHISK